MGKTKTTLEQNRFNVNGKLIALSSPRMLACNNMTEINYFYWEKYIVDFRFHAYYKGLLLYATSIWVQTHWTAKICLALPKISIKFVSAKFSICKVWAHWDKAKYLWTTSVNHTEVNTIACRLFTGKVTCDLRSYGLMVIFNRFDQICCLDILLLVF